MEESGSEGLDELIFAQKDTFFKDVDYVCISDNYWLGKKKPCITYGLRGICYFFIEVECSNKDLHSGVYGGSVHEAMTDLILLMGSLVDKRGNILIPGINEAVAAVTEEEHKLYDDIDFDIEEFAKDVGAQILLHNNKKDILMHRWRFPSLSLHGIEGAFSGSGAKTVIPRKVVGKFSIRLVPNMTPEVVSEQACGAGTQGGAKSGCVRAETWVTKVLTRQTPRPRMPPLPGSGKISNHNGSRDSEANVR
uniref:Peptidase M20 dimerisation domain-containing protein n=1 Tax=Macaca mulatta TaxID=9544 RepID=A0A5F7ZXR4_MACMU